MKKVATNCLNIRTTPVQHLLGMLWFLILNNKYQIAGNESPSSFVGNAQFPDTEPELPNEISAPYEVPQFPIEQIEKKLQIQRQLTTK